MVHPKNVISVIICLLITFINFFLVMNSKEDILKIVGNETFLFANNKDKIMILKTLK